jgi:hypothetical protein
VSPLPPPVITTVLPLVVGEVTDAIVFVPPSGSVSFPSTLIGFGPEALGTVAVSLTAIGASSTQVTVTRTVAVEPPFRV